MALLERPGTRPATSYEIPHEQLDQIPSLTIQAELWRRMIALSDITVGPSKKSVPATRALHLADAVARGPREAFIDGTEFAHLHGNHDGSLHACLPPRHRRKRDRTRFLTSLRGWVGVNGTYDFRTNPQHGVGINSVLVIRADQGGAKFTPVSKVGGSPL